MVKPRAFSVTPRFVGSVALGTVSAISAGATAVVAISVPGIKKEGVVVHDLPELEDGILTTKATIAANGSNAGKLQFGLINTTASPVTPSATQTVIVYVL